MVRLFSNVVPVSEVINTNQHRYFVFCISYFTTTTTRKNVIGAIGKFRYGIGILDRDELGERGIRYINFRVQFSNIMQYSMTQLKVINIEVQHTGCRL